MSDAQAPAQEHQFKELEKFQMFTPAPGVEGRRSRLVFGSWRGNPRITVFTNVPNDTGKGVINAPMNPETFLIFLNLLEATAKENKETKHKISCDTLPKAGEGGERDRQQQQRIHLSDLIFGRDSEGVVWMSVVAEGRPKIKFEFQVSDFHRLYKGDGNQFSKADSSGLQALATIDALRRIFITHAAELKPPYVAGAAPKGKSQGGGYQKQNKNSFDSASGFDDIQF